LGHDATRRNEASEARQVRYRMTMLIPQVASLADALAHVSLRDSAAARGCERVLAEVIAWLRQGIDGTPDEGDALRHAIDALRERHVAEPGDALPAINAAERLRDLVDLWQDCLVLHRAFIVKAPGTPPLAYRDAVPDDSRRFHDHVMMLHAALSPALAFVVAAVAWLYSGWPGGAFGVVLVAVSTAFFAASDAPASLIGRFLLWQTISVAAGLVYLFYLFPQITSFTGVALALAPPLVLVGTLTGRPAFNMGVLLVTSQTISGIAVHNNSAASFDDYANSSLAALGGLAFAAVWSAVTRPFGAQIGARRLARANWREQIALTRRDLRLDRRAALSLLVDRTAQWMPRLALTTGGPLSHMDAVRDLRVSVALIDLREQRTNGATALDPVLDASHRYFRDCLTAHASLPPPAVLLDAIDVATATLAVTHPGAATALLRYRLALLALPPAAAVVSHPASPPTLSPLSQ
ncbi:FUSC family protein, partial [Luteibacter sp.]|uniref:FUSC family protein n=1 Tax=Luteibacter sp. TaxID=1886636 RepID=UPI003F7E2764